MNFWKEMKNGYFWSKYYRTEAYLLAFAFAFRGNERREVFAGLNRFNRLLTIELKIVTPKSGK